MTVPIRLRLALVFGLLGLVTVATVSSIAYVMSAQEVRGSVDDQLVQRISPLAGSVGDRPFADLEADGVSVSEEQALETARAFLEDPSILESEGDTTSIRILWSDGTFTGGPDIAPSEKALEALPTVVAGAEPSAKGAADPKLEAPRLPPREAAAVRCRVGPPVGGCLTCQRECCYFSESQFISSTATKEA